MHLRKNKYKLIYEFGVPETELVYLKFVQIELLPYSKFLS